tara:strand:- start:277 stop:609 length:333 start_codon:yes stop_codon:yes gene_type:complete
VSPPLSAKALILNLFKMNSVFFIKTTKNGTLVSDQKFVASTKRSESETKIHGFKNVWTGRKSGGGGKLGLIAATPDKPFAQGAELEGFRFTDDVCVSDDRGTIYWVDPIV